MADEITLQLSVQVRKGSLRLDIPNEISKIDMDGEFSSGGVQSIGTSAEALEINADLVSPGYGYFKNLDDPDVNPHNTIEIGLLEGSTFVPFIELRGSEPAVLPLADIGLYARATSVEASLQFMIMDR